jgi:protein-S-isoprenylcysteine O-methyltransferase Ste14
VVQVVVGLTTLAWLALEIGLLIRDVVRGTGATALDRGTRALAWLAWTVAAVGAGVAQRELRPYAAWQFGTMGLVTVAVILMWAGLALRIWAVLVLGRAFRTSVEVHAGQQVVDRGPYRWVRHPSYSGLLLIAAGLGLTYGNWLSLALMLMLPSAALLRRVQVEEGVLAGALGRPYTDYLRRTKRLIPGLW